MTTAGAAAPPGRVLPTLNPDGSRRWLRPKPSPGRFWRWRRAVAYGLMVTFFAIPYLRFRGHPLVLLDIPRRQFTIVGTTFLPTDTLLLMLLMVSIAVAIFLVTALLGRVWCGWACPQTVYMEFLFRPIERWLEGGRTGSMLLDRSGRRIPSPRLLKYGVYLVLALFLAHTFLAYFVGIDQLLLWVRRSPFEHPTPFLVMAGTTALIFADFTYFREQVCIVACPYGRLQSVLLDQRSVIVGYDARRGEPRGRGLQDRPGTAGDCIDCSACVLTCPTGIDIRDGLQMECIHCTQCADACDAIMDRIGKPRGLIRYSSQASLAGRPAGLLRPRVVLYPVIMVAAFGLLLYNLRMQSDTDVTILRGQGAPFTREANGAVVNQIRLRITNRDDTARAYRIALDAVAEGRLVAPINPLTVPGHHTEETSVFVVLPPGAFHDRSREIGLRVDGGPSFSAVFPYRLVGPERPPGEDGDEGETNHPAEERR